MSLTLSVIGLGPLGAVHAACMADVGHTVIAVDASMPERALALSRGETPFYEPELQDLLGRTLATGRLTFTSDYADAAEADVHFVCVGTPQRRGEYAADLTWVAGAGSADDVSRLDEGYASSLATGIPRLVTDLPTAELVKAAANSFLATKISFINAMSEVCEAAGADVAQLADAIGHDDRIGRKFLNAGLGFGGGCLPKDIRAFMARAGELGADEALTFLREVDAINLRRRSRMVDLAREQCGGTLIGKRVAVLGAAFKPDSDDIRDSPALDVAHWAHLAGATVTVHDPKALPAARRVHPDLFYADAIEDACRDADVVLHLTEWMAYRDIDPAKLAAVVSRQIVIDGRNALDPIRWREAGWTYRALGRPTA